MTPFPLNRWQIDIHPCQVLPTIHLIGGEGSWDPNDDQAQRLSNWASFADFPLLVLVDDAEKTVATDARFLWTTFTRFEPAGDVYSFRTDVDRHHLAYEGPVCIDARIKPHYPEELFCDPETAERVTARWDEYFPEADVEMGDSDSGHLDE